MFHILKLYLQQGLDIKKIDRVTEFRHKQWLKPWIDFNTKKPKNATSDFEKERYNLMNNRCMEKRWKMYGSILTLNWLILLNATQDVFTILLSITDISSMNLL